jgi:hypothetical protein
MDAVLPHVISSEMLVEKVKCYVMLGISQTVIARTSLFRKSTAFARTVC